MKKTVIERNVRAMQLLRSGHVAASLIALLVTFAMLVASSVAWFSARRTVDSNELGGALAVDDTSAIYKAYMFDLENMIGINRIAGENGEYEELNIANLNMNQYDTIFSVQNKYTPAFAQIQITRNNSMPEVGTVLITIERDSAVAAFDKEGNLAECISSILRFTAIVDSTMQDIGMTDDIENAIKNEAANPSEETTAALNNCVTALYNYINSEERFNYIEENYKGELADSKTFVSVVGEGDGHTHTKADSITIAVDYDGDDWYENDGRWTLNVYLYMSYDVQLIECFIKEHAGDKISLTDTTYEFGNDLKKAAVSYIKPSN